MSIQWLDEIRAVDLPTVGGKAASLGELTGAGLPVPPGFVVTADTYRQFIDDAEISEPLFATLDVDPTDTDGLAKAAAHARDLVAETPLPESVREEIITAYRSLADGEELFVAVRSSATAEDLPDASFAGQHETFLNVTEQTLLDRIQDCWASMFAERAVHYRNEQGFDHATVDIAVVVQQMVAADKSGVLFTRHPSSGDREMIVEAAWGLGEAVVSGTVSPDHYVIDPQTATVTASTIADKKQRMVKDPATGETTLEPVPDADRNARVITDAELEQLVELGRRAEDHYGEPQDVEWAIVDSDAQRSAGRTQSSDSDVFMLQSRPITTIAASETEDGTDHATDQAQPEQPDQATTAETSDEGEQASRPVDELLVRGVSASPGTATGAVRIVRKLDHLDQVTDGDVLVSEMTMPDMVPAMKRAAAIVTDEGGMTSHASIVSREMGVPAVVGTQNATEVLQNGQLVTVDGEMGIVRQGSSDADHTPTEPDPFEAVRPQTPVKPMTATEVKLNLSIPEAAERAAATGADGVGLLRIEHMVISLGKTPEQYIADHGEDAYISELMAGIRAVAEEFYPRPVRARTLDAPTDEFRELEGGADEPHEHNPMLGYRGIRRSLDKPEPFLCELRAFSRLFEMGYDNVELMLPLVNDSEDIERAKAHMETVGIDPTKVRWGVMIETPASALLIEELAATGIDFVSFGTNDLTQYTLAVDRNNEHVVDRFDELHPGVLSLIGSTIESCRELGADTSICGQAASKPAMVQFLVEQGISSISANIDAVRDVQHEVKRVEQKLLLDSVR